MAEEDEDHRPALGEDVHREPKDRLEDEARGEIAHLERRRSGANGRQGRAGA